MKTQRTVGQLPAVLQAKAQELGQLIRGARIRRQWSQKNLAERSAISIATLQRLENGHSAVAFTVILMVCWLLDIPWKVDIDVGQAEYLKSLANERQRARQRSEDRLDDNF